VCNNDLTLRSDPQGRVSKGGQRARTCFETAAPRPPQHEGVNG
jgi:hypothetical protein